MTFGPNAWKMPTTDEGMYRIFNFIFNFYNQKRALKSWTSSLNSEVTLSTRLISMVPSILSKSVRLRYLSCTKFYYCT